jgi:hypothetical protein
LAPGTAFTRISRSPPRIDAYAGSTLTTLPRKLGRGESRGLGRGIGRGSRPDALEAA